MVVVGGGGYGGASGGVGFLTELTVEYFNPTRGQHIWQLEKVRK